MENQTNNFTQENRRASAAERMEMVERYRSSGMTRRAFCESEGLATSTLNWWLHKRNEGPGRRKRVAFREVPLISAGVTGAANWAMEIVSPQGWTVRSRETLSGDDVARLLRESRC
jgi:transposase-like protein